MGNRELFVEALGQALTAASGPEGDEWGIFVTPELAMATWMRDGTLFLHVPDDHKLEVRVPLVAGLRVSSEICAWIHHRNSNQTMGNYWLRPGSDEASWQLVCALKFSWDWMNEYLAEAIFRSCIGLGALLQRDVATEFMERFGGQPWWRTEGDSVFMGAQALAALD